MSKLLISFVCVILVSAVNLLALYTLRSAKLTAIWFTSVCDRAETHVRRGQLNSNAQRAPSVEADADEMVLAA